MNTVPSPEGRQPFYGSPILRYTGAFIAGSVAGIALGMGVEGHTDDVAERKIITAQTCRDKAGAMATITPELADCLAGDKIPGAAPINDEIKEELPTQSGETETVTRRPFEPGMPTSGITAYIEAQRQEAEGIEPGRLALWGFCAGLIGMGAINRRARRYAKFGLSLIGLAN